MDANNDPRIAQSTCSIFDKISQNEHEQVVYCYDKATGLKAIIAIHNTALGPALGGTRIWDYAYDDDALIDVLRLSKGMTYKAALANLKLGGGKAVIMGDVRQVKTEALLRKYGQFINSLHGRYITGPDVNTSMHDMASIAQETQYVQSLPSAMGGSDDPSPFTAYGTYLGIKAAVKKVYGTDQLKGKKIGVEGMGKVGTYLVKHLCKEEAQVYVTDVVQERLVAIAQAHQVHIVQPDIFYDLPLDVYAPCALGATLNDATIARLQCKIVAGAANNQLEDEQHHGRLLFDQGIVYAPDFLINAGGLINIYTDMYYTYSCELAYQHVERIYDTCLEVLNRSEKKHIPPSVVAEQLAEERIHNAQDVPPHE
ncbi:MAG TPA: leucine dehydrogenase [Amoebophilaceae bacterium]|nr:leucine dehydrogenase [Amoebophilaceae bacterium]